MASRRGRIVRRIGLAAALSAVIPLAIAGALIVSESPTVPDAATDAGIDFTAAVNADYSSLPPSEAYQARDGAMLPYRQYEGGHDRLIVLVHGSGWHGMQFHAIAEALATAELGTVLVPDLRGHGAAPERRGDIDHIGQLEDDLADLVDAATASTAYGEVVFGGHSSGGGLVVRLAGGEHGDLADRYVLMAPYLKYDAPTTRPNSGDWAYPATRRIIGLSMLNAVGITALNHLPVISFAMPDEVFDGPLGDTATTQYSYRLNTAFAPRADYGADLAALDRPFLLLTGADDESFIATAYEPTISAFTDSGTYEVLDGTDHIGVTTDPVAIDAVAAWISACSCSTSPAGRSPSPSADFDLQSPQHD